MPGSTEFQEKLQPPVLAEKYPSFTEFPRNSAQSHRLIFEHPLDEKSLDILTQYSVKHNLPLFLTVREQDNQTTVDIINYPREKYQTEALQNLHTHIDPLVSLLTENEIIVEKSPHQELEDFKHPKFRTTLGRKPGYNPQNPVISLDQINQLIKKSSVIKNKPMDTSQLQLEEVNIIAIVPKGDNTPSSIYQEPGIKIVGSRDHLPTVMHLAYLMQQERFAVELLAGESPTDIYLVEVDAHCSSPDDNTQEERIHGITPTPKQPGKWRRNNLHLFTHIYGHSEFKRRREEFFSKRKRMSTPDNPIVDLIESIENNPAADSYESVIKKKLEYVLKNKEMIQIISQANIAITSWVNSWIHPETEFAEDVDRSSLQYPQAKEAFYKHHGKDEHADSLFVDWWKGLRFCRALTLEGSSGKELIFDLFGLKKLKTAISAIAHRISPKLITSPEAFKLVSSFTQASDVDLGIFPVEAFLMIFEELEQERLLIKFLQDATNSTPSIKSYERLPEKSLMIFDLNLPINANDLRLPPGAELKSETIQCRYQRDNLAFKANLPYVDLDFFVEIYHPETETTTILSLLLHEFGITHTDDTTIYRDTRTGPLADSHGQSIAMSVDPHKLSMIWEVNHVLKDHSSNADIAFGLQTNAAKNLLVPNHLSEYFFEMGNGSYVYQNEAVAQLVGRFLVDRIFSLPLSYLYKPVERSAIENRYPEIKKLASKFNPKNLPEPISKELEANIRRSWLIDPRETIHYLINTGFIQFFPQMDILQDKIRALTENLVPFYQRVNLPNNPDDSKWDDVLSQLSTYSSLPDNLKDLNPLELMMKITTLDQG